jgi:hypothetical protein
MKKPIKITLHVTQDHINEGSKNINSENCIFGRACQSLGFTSNSVHVAWDGMARIGSKYYQSSRSMVRFLASIRPIWNKPAEIKKKVKPFTFTLTEI